MSNPVESATPKLPSSPEADGFDLLEFWLRNRNKILLFLALLLVALVIYGVSEVTHNRAVAASEKAFATASKPEDLRKLIADYPSLPAAASAQLELAAGLRAEGKLEESNTLLKSFTEKHAEHPLISGAYTSLAANAELAGKLDDALASYKKVTVSYPTSFSAPAAWIGQARVLQQQGKIEDARHAYETVITSFPESPFTNDAFRGSQKLKK